jgi:hypothetical protein
MIEPFQPDSGIGTVYVYPFVGNGFEKSKDVRALFDTCNAELDSIIQSLSRLNLGLYLDKEGAWLDWIAKGVFGFSRPSIAITELLSSQGGFNNFGFDKRGYGYSVNANTTAFVTLTDDQFKKYLQWHLWRGDGYQFSIPWLKARVARFAGVAISAVSISVTGSLYTITLANSVDANILKYLFVSELLELPENNDYTVILT